MSDVRSSIEAAFQQVSARPETPAPTTAAPAPAQTQESAAPAPEVRAEVAAPRPRAPDGKFAKATEAKPETPSEAHAAMEPEEGKPETPAAAPATSTVKPPPSMRAAIREKWASLEPEVQQEVWRLEREHQKGIQAAAEHRKTATALEKTLAPYKHFLGSDPMGAIQSLFQTAETLRTGDKEAVIANIITANGVDVNRLAQLLNGQPAPQQQQRQQHLTDPRVDALLQRLEQQQQSYQESVNQRVAKDVEAFRPQAEYWDDVREEMGLVLQRAVSRGEQPTIQQVYEAACLLNPEVRPLYLARSQATATAKAATQQARAASASVRHEPTAPKGGNGTTDRRSMIAAAMEAQLRR